MALKITKQEYTKLVKQDMAFLDKNCPQGIELDHVKLVLANSIDMHYPSDGKPVVNTASKCNKQNVMCRADFNKGVELFINYKPVNVARELKDEFQTAIGKQFIEEGVTKWDAILVPLKKFWKFKRA